MELNTSREAKFPRGNDPTIYRAAFFHAPIQKRHDKFLVELKAETPSDLTQPSWQYRALSTHFDEFLTASGHVREHWKPFSDALGGMGRGEFERRWQSAQQIVRNNAITYNVYGDSRGVERLWPFDPIPLILPEHEWNWLERAIAQRATLLNAILDDSYGSQSLLAKGLLPPELIFANPNFLRACHGFPVSGKVRLHFYGVDVARSTDGRWWVVADRTQVPSGAGYALENRLVSTRTLSNVFNQYSIRPLQPFFSARRSGLLSLAPGNKRLVLLTPGPFNETYFEHSYLAKTFGVPLVEGADLTVRDRRVYLKTLEGLEPIDMIMRRQDDSYCDPLELRGDSLLGVPGLLDAVRAGNVVIANSLGSGLVETPAHKAFLPGLCRQLLGEDLQLPSVATWWCGHEQERRYVLEHLHELIVKPAFPRFGQHPLFGPNLTSFERQELARKIEAQPANYIAQEMIHLSTSPVWTDEGLSPRHVMMRVYACWDGSKYMVMPGALARVAQESASVMVNMQHGGASKDTWVIGRVAPTPTASVLFDPDGSATHRPSSGDLPSRVADNLFWLGRYTERVESLIRLLRTVVPALSGEEDVAHHISLDTVLRLLVTFGLLPETILSTPIGEQLHQLESMLTGMVHDPAGISNLGWNLKQIRRVAWPLKERLSSDTWRVLQQLEVDASSPVNPYLGKRPASLLLHLDRSILALSAFAGLLSDSTTRGNGWRFLEIGRRLERALQMIELLLNGIATLPPTAESLDLVLQIADSSITYRTRYLTALRSEYVLDLLLLDETNPRAVGFQLAALCDLVDRLPNADPDSRMSYEKRRALKVLTAVRLANSAELARINALTPFLESLRGDLAALSEVLTAHYLSHVIPSRLIST